MDLPFTQEQFLDVFGAYNRTFWPVALVLWAVTALTVVRLIGRRPRAGVHFSLVLAMHWAWVGLAYHLVYFRRINPAAVVFGLAFLFQAVLFARHGRGVRALHYEPHGTTWSSAGIILMLYALVYPVLGLASGLSYPRMPTFGVPCPTTILTIGALLLVRTREMRVLAIIPLLWSAIGGSAAFLFGVWADLLMVVAGILLIAYIFLPVARRHRTRA